MEAEEKGTPAMVRMRIMAAIAEERSRQDAKWGIQRHQSPVWMTILTEEVGEVAEAILDRSDKEVALELVQVIAVGVAWLEAMAAK